MSARPLLERFPLPLVPNGWFAVSLSRELKKNKVRPLHVLNRELVAFRDERGRATVLDAFCPHLGAHLGHGGRVVDGGVECPFHAWRFAADGRCVHATGCDRPPRVALRSWPTAEVDGVIFVWHHADGLAPTWEVPPFPTDGAPYTKPLELRYRIASHIQEFRENIGDETHFTVIHKWPLARPAEFVPDGHRAALRFTNRYSLFGRSLDLGAQVDMVGPGIQHLRTFEPAPGRVTMLFTPIDETESASIILVSGGKLFGVPMTRLLNAYLVRWLSRRDIDFEALIWNNKLYLERPIFVGKEQTQRKIREWSKQFYSDEKKPPKLQMVQA